MTQLPGGLTIGHPQYSIPRKSNRQEGNIQYIQEPEVYTEFAGRENLHPQNPVQGGDSSELFFCVPRLIRPLHREAARLNDCKLLSDEKVYSTNGFCRSGRMLCNSCSLLGAGCECRNNNLCLIAGLYIIGGLFSHRAPARLVFFNPYYQLPSARAKLPS